MVDKRAPVKRLIRAADLFCGAGGTSTGLRWACENLGYNLALLAINHWDVAIATHSSNHPDAEHMCAGLDAVDPRRAVPGGRLDLLLASPECQFFSVARGGKPVSDQGRASAWLILRWAELLYIDTLLIENVREFLDWCPVGANGRPMKSKKGETFRAFIAALQSLGYRVEWKLLNAADYGAATTRQRLFIQARRGRRAITWPTPTHSKTGGRTLFGRTKRWRAAREIIDWSIPGNSIFTRKRPLSPATIARIIAGLEKFGGPELQPFLVILRNNQDAMSIDRTVPAITTSGAHIGLAQPFITAFRGSHKGKTDGSRRNHSIDEPLRTMDTSYRFGIVEPFILAHRQFDEQCVDSIERPLRTITASGGGDFAVVEPKPFLVPQFGDSKPKSIDEPVGAITTTSRGIGLAQPFLVPFFGERKGQGPRIHSVEEPLPTVTGHGAGGLVSPFLLQLTHGGRVHDVAAPVPTITTAKRGETSLVQPYLLKYCSTGGARSVEEPVDTITTKDRYGLVTPLVIQLEDGTLLGLDIHFRMLTPRELARAMSFPDHYQFSGNREAVVKQIGNAVDASMSHALCEAVLA